MSRAVLFACVIGVLLLAGTEAKTATIEAELVDDIEAHRATIGDSSIGQSGELSAEAVAPRFQELYPSSGAAYNPYAAYTPSFAGLPTVAMPRAIVPLTPENVDIVHYTDLQSKISEELTGHRAVKALKLKMKAKAHKKKLKELAEQKLRDAAKAKYDAAKKEKELEAKARKEIEAAKSTAVAQAQAAADKAVAVAEKLVAKAKIDAAAQVDAAKYAAQEAVAKQESAEAAADALRASLAAQKQLNQAHKLSKKAIYKKGVLSRAHLREAEIDAANLDVKVKATRDRLKERTRELVKSKKQELVLKDKIAEKLKNKIRAQALDAGYIKPTRSERMKNMLKD